MKPQFKAGSSHPGQSDPERASRCRVDRVSSLRVSAEPETEKRLEILDEPHRTNLSAYPTDMEASMAAV